MDKVLIRGLKVNAILGIYDFERVTPQPISIDLTLYTQQREPNTLDEFDGCVDYEKISIQVRELVISAKKLTVEALAEQISEYCLTADKVTAVDVKILKTNAIEFTDGVGVEIHRIRGAN